MINKKLHTTSPEFGKRNILGVFSSQPSGSPHRQTVRSTGLGSLSILFIESLVKRGIRDKIVLRWCTDLRPFLEYIEERHGVTAVTGLKRSHVEAYAAVVRTAYEAGRKSFTEALDANGLLSAVRMFCLYLYAIRVIPEDYGYAAPTIPYPGE